MHVRGISWVGVKTGSYQPMKQFFAEVAGIGVDHERPGFAVFRLPDGDKLEIFGPEAADPPEQFAGEKVVAGLLVDDIDEAIAELRAAGVELIGEKQGWWGGVFLAAFPRSGREGVRARDGSAARLARCRWYCKPYVRLVKWRGC